jgi:hypothetical protein
MYTENVIEIYTGAYVMIEIVGNIFFFISGIDVRIVVANRHNFLLNFLQNIFKTVKFTTDN